MKITNFEMLKLLPLSEKDSKSYYKKEPCSICKKKFMVISKYLGKFKIMTIILG